MRNNTTLRVGTVVLALVAGGVVGACSNSNSFAKACAAQVKLNHAVGTLPLGGPDEPPGDAATIKKDFPPVAKAVDELDAALPEHPASVRKVLAALRKLGTTGDASTLANFDTTQADAFMYAKCDGTDQERPVTAKEYQYDGGTQAVHAGVVRFRLHNGGRQLHEMLLMRSKDGSTPTKEALVALAGQGDNAFAANFDFVDATLAPQGKDSYITTKLSKGTYVMLCTIPVGTTSFDQLQNRTTSGPPHFARGMMRTFTVS